MAIDLMIFSPENLSPLFEKIPEIAQPEGILKP